MKCVGHRRDFIRVRLIDAITEFRETDTTLRDRRNCSNNWSNGQQRHDCSLLSTRKLGAGGKSADATEEPQGVPAHEGQGGNTGADDEANLRVELRFSSRG